MRRVALIYNPASGQRPARRDAIIAKVAAVFRSAGIEVEVVATKSPESAGPQAQQAIDRGCDSVIACGGDGTVHEVLQSMVGGNAAVGVIPMGTANALACDLGLPASPVKAARRLLAAVPSRYFVVAAGVGVDGLFFSRLDSRLKRRLGYLAYLVEALRMAATYNFPRFSATFQAKGGAAPQTAEVSQLLTVRIANFGGLVQNLVPGAALGSRNLHAIAFKTSSRLHYVRFMAAVMLRRHTYSSPIELIDCAAVECRDLEASRSPTYVEADGELLGTLPVRIEVVPDALTLLVPPKS